MACMRNGRNALSQIIRDTKKNVYSSESERMMNPLVFACQGVRHRKLEVILTTNVDKLGKAGETVKVAPGHFRNHLMPKLLAVPNIDKYAYLIREQRKNAPMEEKEEEVEVKVVPVSQEVKMKEYEKLAKRLDNARLVLRRNIDLKKFRTRATKEDSIELRDAVTKDDILAEVARQLSIGLEPDNVHLPTPLTTVGEYEVRLRLPRSIPLPAGKVHWTLDVKIRCA
ncbi:uncharacterized protein LOC126804174 [Argentina anserina]|uniref:uncharacterized protein LOC126804174 n=1 Tax=Argentina anserina TaxID=57926 RepID=UPI0021764AF0|nr:uncharacterized protein LOC126804174 [Potentilla anserina]